MMFKATVGADTFSAFIEPVSALVSECKIHLTEDGLDIRAVCAANVAMVDVSLDAGAFESYDADGGTLGVDLERLEDVLGMADSDDLVAFELDDETRKLHIEIDGLEYTLALIDPDSIRQEPDIPDLDLPATYVFEGRRLDRAVTVADLVSDHIRIEGVAADTLAFSADGDTDDAEDRLVQDDLLSGRLDGEAVASLFSLDYLKDMKKAVPSDADVSLLLGDEMPIKMRYSKSDGDVSVLNLLAPRIQSD